jgi:hypothetical protein
VNSKDAREFAEKAGAEIMIYPPVDPQPEPCAKAGCGCAEALAIRNETLIESLRAAFRGRWPSLA